MRNWTPAQLLAIEASGCDLLVSAAAGSGKTAVLTERLIRRLTDRDNPADLSKMLIVTFTRAAASELRERIGTALESAIEAEPERKDLVRQSLGLESAHIGTIHSFCLSLLRENFAVLGLAPAIRVADETEILMLALRVMDEVIDDFYENSENKPEIITKAGKKFHTDFQTLADTFVSDRDDKLAVYFYDIYKETMNYPEGIAILQASLQNLSSGSHSDFFDTVWGKIIKRGLVDELSYYKKIYEEAVEYFTGGDSVVEQKFAPAFICDRDFISGMISAVNESYSSARSFALSYKKTAIGRKKTEENEKTDFYKSVRTDFGKFIDKAGKKKLSASPEKISELMTDAASFCGSLFCVLDEFSKRFTEEKRRKGIIDYSDIEHLTLRLLTDENGNPTNAAQQCGAEYNEIYIDEYQDISPIQDKIFNSIANQNRFMVGDIKQSIYGFRGSAPDIFADYRNRFPKLEAVSDESQSLNSKKGHTVFLSHNFRCDDTIIDFTNAVFSSIMQNKYGSSLTYGNDDMLVFSKNYGEKHHAVPAHVVLISPSDVQNEEYSYTENNNEKKAENNFGKKSPDNIKPEYAEAEFVASESKKLIASGRYKPEDIRILLRSGASDTERFAKAFSRRGIPFENVRTAGFFERPHTMLLLSLLRCIDNPLHDIPLASVLKSPLFGFTMDELIAVKKDIHPESASSSSLLDIKSNEIINEHDDSVTAGTENKTKSSLFDCLCAYTEKYGFKKGKVFLDELSDLRSRAVSMPSDKLIWHIFSSTPIMYCGENNASAASLAESSFSADQRRADLLRFYDYARSYEASSFRGLNAFVSSINDLLAKEPHFVFDKSPKISEKAVCAMTIHASKGLEFPVCFICGSAKKFNKQDSSELVLIDGTLGACPKLRLDTGFARINTPMRSAAVQKNDEQETDEELRVLYVAMTRAKEILYITAGTAAPEVIISEARLCASYPSRFSFSKNASYMKWLLTAFAYKNGLQADSSDLSKKNTKLGTIMGSTGGEICAQADLIRYQIKDGMPVLETDGSEEFHSSVSIKNQKSENEKYLSSAEKNLSEDTVFKVIEKRLNKRYPDSYSSRLPAKISVSELYPGFLDESPALTPEEAIRRLEAEKSDSGIRVTKKSAKEISDRKKLLHIPHFLENDTMASTGAEKGTAVHVFLQFADWNNVTENGIQKEIERLIQKRFITPAMGKLISLPMLEVFFKSSLFKELCSAEKVYRELRFNVLLPAENFTENQDKKNLLKGEKLLVQGIIDCLYITSTGKLRLLDYKTDYVRGSKNDIKRELVERYRTQLLIYKQAATIITGKAVDKCIIYSLASGLEIEI